MSTHGLVHEYLENAKKPVQLVKHFDEVPRSKIEYPIIAQKKYDGVYTILAVIEGEVALYSRVGKKLYFEKQAFAYDYSRLPEGIYIAEMCNPFFTLEQLSGVVNPNRKKEWDSLTASYMYKGARLYFHDYLTVDELLGAHSDVLYSQRQAILDENLAIGGLSGYTVFSNWLYDAEEVQRHAQYRIDKGDEGIVLKQDCDWVAGHKGYRSMKVVRGISLDLRCVDVQYGKGKREGLIGALVLELGSDTFKADLGRGWTDVRRAELTRAFEHDLDDNPIGKIWEVQALQMSSTGTAMRLPKVLRVRDDKDEPDTL